MHRLCLFFFAFALPLAAQSITSPSSLPQATSLSSDYFLVLEGTTVHLASSSAVSALAQSGAVQTGGSYSNPSWLTAVNWSIIGSTPTTISGYGITDGVTLTGTQTLTNKSLSFGQITGAPIAAYAVASGTNTYTASPSPALSAYTPGTLITIKFGNANTGGASLNLNGLGAVTIQQSGAALTAGTIAAGAIEQLLYDGTVFNLVSGGGGGVSSFNTRTGAVTLTSDDLAGLTLPASQVSGLATVATSGAYSDLTGTPTIPPAITVTNYGTGPAGFSSSTVLNIPLSAESLSQASALPNGTTGATLAATDNTAAVATDAFVHSYAIGNSVLGSNFGAVLYGTSSGAPAVLAGSTANAIVCLGEHGSGTSSGPAAWYNLSAVAMSGITVQTGTLTSGSATATVATGCHPWVQDTASAPSGPMSVTVSTTDGTTATIHGTGSDTFTLFNAGSQ